MSAGSGPRGQGAPPLGQAHPGRQIPHPTLTRGGRVDYLICDEAQFYTRDQIDQLAKVVDELQIDVFAFGILTDFRSQLFAGSQRLVELADRMNVLQVEALCWCGKRATHNARTENGEMVTEGDVIVVGDVEVKDNEAVPPSEIAYEVLCRQHHRRRREQHRGVDGVQGEQGHQARLAPGQDEHHEQEGRHREADQRRGREQRCRRLVLIGKERLEVHVRRVQVVGVVAVLEVVEADAVRERFRPSGAGYAPGMFAARLWWLLRWLGHREVAVRSGSSSAW